MIRVYILLLVFNIYIYVWLIKIRETSLNKFEYTITIALKQTEINTYKTCMAMIIPYNKKRHHVIIKKK